MATLVITVVNVGILLANLLVLGVMVKLYTEIYKGTKIDKIGKV